MKKCLLITLLSVVTGFGCRNAVGQSKLFHKGNTGNFSKIDLNKLAQSDYSSLTQVYDAHSLANRDVTFRDERLLVSRNINTIFYNLPVYRNTEEWARRKEYLKEHVLVCAGLWPMPEKNPLRPVYYHKIVHDDYIVETVSIETYPGFFLAGNIYRPKGNGPFPAILSPHGHWKTGRLTNDNLVSVPGRCINLARQGYVVFAYDMVGYDDTRQVSHRFANDSISGLYGINLLGLQLRNSIRALDFLLSLPGVDKNRVGITGASGGGTQSFLLAAVDDRFQSAAIVNMVSNNMQGGDLCENAPGLRTNTFNVEIASMVAPKPLLLVSDTHDWTYNTRNTIFPMVESIYHLYNATEKARNAHFDYAHNYNKASREAMYEFFAKSLLHDSDINKFRESAFVPDSDKYLLAFLNAPDASSTKTFGQLPASEYHGLPDTLDEEELKILLKNMYIKQLNEYWPKDTKSLENFKSVYGTAFRHLTGVISPGSLDCKIMGRSKGKDFIATRLLIGRKDMNDWIPCVLYQPFSAATSTVIVTADKGKIHWVTDDDNAPNELVAGLLTNHCNVLAPDLFKQGEHILQDSTLTARDENAPYFTTYNLTDRQQQVQDLVTIIKFINETHDLSHSIDLYASGNTGLTAVILGTITNSLHKWIVDGDHFDPGTDQAMLTLDLPGIMRVGGLKTVLALNANKQLILYNADASLLSSGAKDISRLESNNAHFSITTTGIGNDTIIDFLKH
ncbi:MAG: acetylxylan esterase [Ginsengibacter sp.]